ncbi:hypothetical protein LTR78_008695 [Recurvomyces mirabilis]|uniref:BTB domain-containing protein n=1 Tax=Recurvomyces mirabilis TaxID=574656 RepID=A0AAE0TSX7_9PEZI|nr:hypothetical protein LTR78_008695 [Recurvomyces mirabilis]KAK5159220.1 hypothetical protein LTS14_002362 [Recurvomyces mirabilis]
MAANEAASPLIRSIGIAMDFSCILVSQSAFFARACEGPFREARDRIIDLRGDDQAAVEAMLYYFYHGTYHAASTQQPHSLPLFHARVYFLADKYFVAPLPDLALANFKIAVLRSWHSEGFADAAQEIYNNTTSRDHRLRIVIRETISGHAAALFPPPASGTKLEQMLADCPQFAADLVPVFSAALREQATTTDRLGMVGRAVREVRPVPELGDLADIGAEPSERLYRCPRCEDHFRVAIYDRDFYTHHCSPATVAQQSQVVSDTRSGYAWRTQYTFQ